MKIPILSSYDVVIIGGGLHSLATAYYLAKEHGITDIAIIEKNYIIEKEELQKRNLIASPFTFIHPQGIRGCFQSYGN